VVEAQPEIRVIIVTAYGTVDNAVDAMKLGAVDFIQKPFTPQQIRDLVSKVLDRGRLAAEEAQSYDALVELARLRMNERRFDAAREIAEKATKVAPKRPEAWNLLGIASEVLRERGKALDFYRMALQVDGTYEPARRNLERGLPGSEDRSLDLGGPAKGKDE
jgi:YesN/AraC family two-component response regulator